MRPTDVHTAILTFSIEDAVAFCPLESEEDTPTDSTKSPKHPPKYTRHTTNPSIHPTQKTLSAHQSIEAIRTRTGFAGLEECRKHPHRNQEHSRTTRHTPQSRMTFLRRDHKYNGQRCGCSTTVFLHSCAPEVPGV